MNEIDLAGLNRAIAHIRRGLDIIQELSQAHATIEDTNAGEQ